MKTEILTPHQPRPIRYVHPIQGSEYTIKVYWISAYEEVPDETLISMAEEFVLSEFQNLAGQDHHGYGFMIVHQGRDGNYIVLDWWVGENMIKQKIYHAPLEMPYAFSDFSGTGIVTCVWEVQVLAFEANAWKETVLSNQSRPDFSGYQEKYLSCNY